MRLGFVGAGRMGRPMVDRLVAAGHEVRVLGRSDDLAEAAADAEAVVLCVHTDEQVREVCTGGGIADAMPAGAVLIVHTTGSPQTVEALAQRGVTVVDAPVSGGPHDIAAGAITLYVGGTDEAVTAARPVLSAYGDPILHVGPTGSGQKVKLINNAVFAANIGLLAEAVDLAAQLGVEEQALLDAMQHGSAASRALAGVGARGSVAGFAHAVGEFLGKDLRVVTEVARDLGGDLGALADAHHALTEVMT